MTENRRENDRLHGEEAIVALLAPLTDGDPGAFGLKDDCALLTPEAGTELVLKTDPVAEGVHFLAGRCARGHRLEGAGGERLGPRRQGRHARRLSDGALLPRGAIAALACRVRGRAPGGADALRLPPPGRRHRPPAGAADGLHHRHRLGAAGRRWCGAAPRGPAMCSSSPAPSATPAWGWRWRASRRLAAAWGLSQAEADHLVAPLPPARAAAGPGAAAAPIRLRRHGPVGRPGEGPRAHAARLRRRRPPRAPPTCRSPTRPARCWRASRSGSPSSSPAATTTRSSPPSRPHRLRRVARPPPPRPAYPSTEIGAAGPLDWPERGNGLLIDGPDGRPLAVGRAGWDHF